MDGAHETTSKPVLSARDQRITRALRRLSLCALLVLVLLLSSGVIGLLAYWICFGAGVLLYLFAPPFFLHYDGVATVVLPLQKTDLDLEIEVKEKELAALRGKRLLAGDKARQARLAEAGLVARAIGSDAQIWHTRPTATRYFAIMAVAIIVVYFTAQLLGWK